MPVDYDGAGRGHGDKSRSSRIGLFPFYRPLKTRRFMNEDSIISRDEALSLGMRLYFTGKPCKKGHISKKYTHGGCFECRRAYRAKLVKRQNIKLLVVHISKLQQEKRPIAHIMPDQKLKHAGESLNMAFLHWNMTLYGLNKTKNALYVEQRNRESMIGM